MARLSTTRNIWKCKKGTALKCIFSDLALPRCIYCWPQFSSVVTHAKGIFPQNWFITAEVLFAFCRSFVISQTWSDLLLYSVRAGVMPRVRGVFLAIKSIFVTKSSWPFSSLKGHRCIIKMSFSWRGSANLVKRKKVTSSISLAGSRLESLIKQGNR